MPHEFTRLRTPYRATGLIHIIYCNKFKLIIALPVIFSQISYRNKYEKHNFVFYWIKFVLYRSFYTPFFNISSIKKLILLLFCFIFLAKQEVGINFYADLQKLWQSYLTKFALFREPETTAIKPRKLNIQWIRRFIFFYNVRHPTRDGRGGSRSVFNSFGYWKKCSGFNAKPSPRRVIVSILWLKNIYAIYCWRFMTEIKTTSCR